MADLSSDNRFLGELAPRAAVVAGIGGLALLAFGALVTQMAEPAQVEAGLGPWERFLRAYIVAFCVVLSLSLGGLWFVMLQHLTKAGWSVVLRRVAEAFASNLTWLWILFIPILIGVFKTDLYGWRHPDPADEVLAHKAAFFAPWFWVGRTVLYFAVWAVLARYFLGRSAHQDETGDPAITLRMQKMAAPGMILYAFTQTFAIIDWVMSLEPHWFSTMFGVYFFAASCCGFFAATILACMAMQRAGRLAGVITTEHYHDLGKALFAFGVVFWAYIAYSQYMLIWYANIPEETMWFIARQLGGWQGLSIFLVLGHFLGPFLILLSRWPKRWRGFLALGAAWMLFMHFIDVYWLVMPAVPVELVTAAASYQQLVATFLTGVDPVSGVAFNELYGLHWRIADVACVLGMAGLFIAGTAWCLRERSLIPIKDPRLPESLAFENY